MRDPLSFNEGVVCVIHFKNVQAMARPPDKTCQLTNTMTAHPTPTNSANEYTCVLLLFRPDVPMLFNTPPADTKKTGNTASAFVGSVKVSY